MAGPMASAAASGRGISPAASIVSMSGMMRSSSLVCLNMSRQPSRTARSGLPLGLDAATLKATGVDEAHGRRIARSQHGRFGHAVQAGRGGRQAAVGQVGSVPGFGVVAAARPLHAELLRQQLVAAPHARAFDATQLLDAAPFGWLFTEAHGVHLAHHLQAQAVVQRQPGLVQQAVAARAAGLAGGIQPHAGFTHPHQQRAHARGQRGGAVADAGAGLQHDAGDAAHRDVRAHAGGVDHDEGTVEHVDLAALDEDDADAFLDGQGLECGQDAVHSGASSAAASACSTTAWPNRWPPARSCWTSGATAGTSPARLLRIRMPSVPTTTSCSDSATARAS